MPSKLQTMLTRVPSSEWPLVQPRLGALQDGSGLLPVYHLEGSVVQGRPLKLCKKAYKQVQVAKPQTRLGDRFGVAQVASEFRAPPKNSKQLLRVGHWASSCGHVQRHMFISCYMSVHPFATPTERDFDNYTHRSARL